MGCYGGWVEWLAILEVLIAFLNNINFEFFFFTYWTGKMTQWEKAPATYLGDLSLIPGTKKKKSTST